MEDVLPRYSMIRIIACAQPALIRMRKEREKRSWGKVREWVDKMSM